MEQWAGIEPALTGFEDQQLIHLAHHCGFSHNESGGSKTRTCVSLFMFIGFCKYFCPYTDKFHYGTNDIYLKHFFPIKLHHHPHDEGDYLNFCKNI